MRKRSCIPCLLIALCFSSCELETSYPGGVEFDNPFCQTITLSFSRGSSSSNWNASIEIPNIISEDEELLKVEIVNSSGIDFQSLLLSSPPIDDGDQCIYSYPHWTGTELTSSTSSGDVSYTAWANSWGCTPSTTMGNWVLLAVCSDSISTDSLEIDVEVCFTFSE